MGLPHPCSLPIHDAAASHSCKRRQLILLQIGGDNEPLVAHTFAVGLSGAAIARKGVEKMAVVLNLVAVRCLHYSQFPWQRGGAGRGTGACCQQWWPGRSTPA